jgi:hypothetical protein
MLLHFETTYLPEAAATGLWSRETPNGQGGGSFGISALLPVSWQMSDMTAPEGRRRCFTNCISNACKTANRVLCLCLPAARVAAAVRLAQ